MENLVQRGTLLEAPVPLNTIWSRAMIAGAAIFTVLTTVSVILRLLARRSLGLALERDDWSILVGLIFFYWHTVSAVLITVLGGAGHNIATLSPTVLEPHLKALMQLQIAYALCLSTVKVSILLLFTRIFGVNRNLRIAVRLLLVLTLGWTVVAICVGTAMCHPFAYNYDKTIVGGHCANIIAGGTSVACIEIAINLVMWFLPIPKVWRLQMPAATKLAISAVFAIGIIDVLMGVLRLVSIRKVNFAADWTLDFCQMYFYSELEAGLAILIACAPTLKPLFRAKPTTRDSSQLYELSDYSRIMQDERMRKSALNPGAYASMGNKPAIGDLGLDLEGEAIKIRKDISIHQAPVET